MIRLVTYCLLFGLVLTPTGLKAADGGTESPFSLGTGASELALGGANLAVVDAWTAPFWNPSRLAAAERISLGGFHTRLYDDDVAYQYLGLVYPTLDWGAFGLGVFRLNIGGIEKRDINNFYIEDIDDSRLAFYFAYGRTINKYNFGFAVTLEHHALDTYKATSSPGINLSIGRVWVFDKKLLTKVSAGINGRNLLKPKLKLLEEELEYPYSIGLGLSAEIRPNPNWDHRAILSAGLTKVDYVDLRPALGLEYEFSGLLSLRGGVRDGKLSFGAGLSYKMLSFDYSLVDRDMGSLHMFSLTSSFGLPRSEKKQMRDKKREMEFNTLMSDHMTAYNRELVEDLVRQGDEMFGNGDLTRAGDFFDRALFLARNNNLDTVAIYEKTRQVEKQLDDILRAQRYRQYIDSAQDKYENEDYIAARYFANLALTEVPNSAQAQQLVDKADREIRASSSREEMIQNRLWLADSLVDYGRINEAESVLKTLAEFAPDHSGVRLAIKRVEFERLRNEAVTALADNNLPKTVAVLDSALAMFPGHKWWLDFKDRVDREIKVKKTTPEPVAPPKPVVLSAEVKSEVEEAYKTAQNFFKKGDLNEAITHWEKVERLAPNYASVREYLVNAYKYVGVELYSRNDLKGAVGVWRKAAEINPANQEIIKYINRTENEIRKLEELSYEHNEG
ncbi:MAG: hypothetical protein ACOYVF_05345 [Candidatus Zixiibacteriota bacterium]